MVLRSSPSDEDRPVDSHGAAAELVDEKQKELFGHGVESL